MIRAAPQRYRQVERRQSGVHEIEQDSIFDCEQLAQPVIRGVMDGEARLQGVNLEVRGEPRRREAQLIGVGFVLGVVDHDQIAARRR